MLSHENWSSSGIQLKQFFWGTNSGGGQRGCTHSKGGLVVGHHFALQSFNRIYEGSSSLPDPTVVWMCDPTWRLSLCKILQNSTLRQDTYVSWQVAQYLSFFSLAREKLATQSPIIPQSMLRLHTLRFLVYFVADLELDADAPLWKAGEVSLQLQETTGRLQQRSCRLSCCGRGGQLRSRVIRKFENSEFFNS